MGPFTRGVLTASLLIPSVYAQIAQVEHVTRAEIVAAIQAGENGILRDVTCEARDREPSEVLRGQYQQRLGNGAIAVVFRGPLARIATSAAER
jgi:hypothetical protein